jgi:hypothetical protein
MQAYLFGLFDTINRTNSHALRAILLVFTLIAGVWIDNIDVPLCNGIGGTFGKAKPAGRAFICNPHSHNVLPPKPLRYLFQFSAKYRDFYHKVKRNFQNIRQPDTACP